MKEPTAMNAAELARTENGLLHQAAFADTLMAPPAAASSLGRLFESALHTGRSSEDGLETGFDAESFAWRNHEAPGRVELEYTKLARGVWLVYGDLQTDEALFAWHREDRAMTFSALLRGAVMLGTPSAPHRRAVYTEGCAVATACSGDTLICRHPLPGLRYQVVSLLFDGDDAMQEFGLDPAEARRWIASADPGMNRAEGAFRVAVSALSLPAMRVAQAIFWNAFSGSRRRLYLRSKVGELLCHLLSSPVLAPGGVPWVGGGVRQDDSSLAAIVHAAMSDPDDCPEVADLAARLHVSTGRLVAAFKSKYGMSPREHAIATRMARARRLLRQTRTSLLDVALASGYEHHSSFSTAYRRTFGETPLETRRAGATG